MRETIKKLTPKPLIECYKSIRYLWITLLFYVFRLIPIQKKRVIFLNVWGFGDNGKYVATSLRNISNDAEIFFICNHPKQFLDHEGIRLLKTNSFGAVYYMATAMVWVGSNRMEGYIKKRRGQYYIQLWHGGLALKKIEGDCANYLGEEYIKNAKKDSLMTNLYVSNGKFCTEMYRRAFWYYKEIMECGSPRMDALIHPNETDIIRIKKELNIPLEHKVVLYGPTYRDSKDTLVYKIDTSLLVKALKMRFGGEWIVITRLHPLVQGLSDKLSFESNVINASHYKDMYELMMISDVLITDYSNIMFEFSYLKRPVFLYAKDQEQYIKERGLYFKFDQLPYPISDTMDQLYQQICSFDETFYLGKQKDFFQEVGVKETGYASKMVARRIVKVISK